MSEKDYLQDITEIKSIMDKSTRFISLSGLSGILVGIYALVGATIGNLLIKSYQSGNGTIAFLPISYFEFLLFGVALTVLVFSILTAFILTKKKATKNNDQFWNNASKRLMKHFLIPLITGGLFCGVLYQYGLIGLIAPSTLIFYGLACVNASKYTLGDVYYLGITNIVIGLVATQFIGYGLYFWALGFGICHIIYGFLMLKKEES